MTGKKIIFYILAAFITGTLLLIYIQFNSAKNINMLISGNEKLLAEFKISRELKELESDIFSVESKTRGTFISGDSLQLQELEGKIEEVKSDIIQLQKISNDDTTIKYIDELNKLIDQKLHFSLHLVDSFHHSGKNLTGNIIATQKEKAITDSIINILQIVDSTRQILLSQVTVINDKSGKKAQQLSNILIVLVLVSGACLFWYIISIIQKQTLLIQQLNISEKKVKESAAIKEKFLANMSHEIRTPVNAILGFTNLLRRKNLDDESKEYVQTIHKSGESLLTIINDILDVSKIEAGMLRIESAPFSIRELLHSVEFMLMPKAVEKQLKLFVHADAAVPDMLEGDAARLTQILVNLADNSLKFTSNGSVSINITNEGLLQNIINTGITVTDTGIGIEKEKQQYIFERFKQAEDSVTRKYGGTGLGLAIVNDLVVLQNGSITLESEPGKGTSFKIIIPYKIAQTQFNSNLTTTTDLKNNPGFKNIFILVVEDNEINQSLIKHLFKNWQIKYDLANNGREAVEKLEQKKYDLILMDIQMPEMDGYTATEIIRRNLKLNTPIIAMTAHVLAGEREKCLGYGMNEYISKPIHEEELQKIIAEFTIKEIDVPQKKEISEAPSNPYRYINLHYLKEVSNGNTEYEKAVTMQFAEMIPDDLIAIENAWQRNDISLLRRLAHNMKTTVSVMGLNKLLQQYLDAIEYNNLDAESFRSTLLSLKYICERGSEEAMQFYATLEKC
jgi:signal transduction histidine kinase/CheY-like chemotaxis protein